MQCQKKSCRRERLEATGGTKGGHAVDGGSKLQDVRGDRLLRNAMERGAPGSELGGNPAEQRAIWSREDSRFRDVFMANTPFFNLLHCGIPNL